MDALIGIVAVLAVAAIIVYRVRPDLVDKAKKKLFGGE